MLGMWPDVSGKCLVNSVEPWEGLTREPWGWRVHHACPGGEPSARVFQTDLITDPEPLRELFCGKRSGKLRVLIH